MPRRRRQERRTGPGSPTAITGYQPDGCNRSRRRAHRGDAVTAAPLAALSATLSLLSVLVSLYLHQRVAAVLLLMAAIALAITATVSAIASTRQGRTP